MHTILTGLDSRKLLVWALFVGIFAMALRPASDSDMWWHLRSGQHILETGAIPRLDPFSHTRLGQPWVDQSWLAQVALWGTYHLLGFGGLALGVALMVLATFIVVFLDSPGHLYVRVGGVLLAALASAVFWSPRPQMASLLLLAGVAYLLHRHWRGGKGRALWLLPPLFALWANLHAAWMAGLLLVGCGVGGDLLAGLLARSDEEARRLWRRAGALALMLVLSAGAVCLNPQGPAMLRYPFQTVGMKVLQEFIQEWASPDFHRLSFHPFIWLFLATACALALSRKAKDPGDLAAFVLFAALALTSGRNVALFAVVAAPMLTEHATEALAPLLARAAVSDRRPTPIWQGGMNGGIGLLILLAMGVRAWAGPLNPSAVGLEHRQQFPVQAAQFLLQERPAGALFNSYNWGGYLIWSLYPAYQVYVDGRTDLYDDTLLQEYLQVAQLQAGWEEVLERRGVRLVLVESGQPLAAFLAQREGWSVLYQDGLAVVLARQLGGGGP
ncbi:MAG: hypothetical protein ACUVXG_01120 [Anaerolineae bacterium]